MATTASNGETITSSGTEQTILLSVVTGVADTEQVITLELVSGSVQFAVGESIAAKHRTYSSAGDKAIRTVNNSNRTLRCLGMGTFTIGW